MIKVLKILSNFDKINPDILFERDRKIVTITRDNVMTLKV